MFFFPLKRKKVMTHIIRVTLNMNISVLKCMAVHLEMVSVHFSDLRELEIKGLLEKSTQVYAMKKCVGLEIFSWKT